MTNRISSVLIIIASLGISSWVLSWAWNTVFQRVPEMQLDFWQVMAIIIIVFSVKIIENILYSIDIRNIGNINGKSE